MYILAVTLESYEYKTNDHCYMNISYLMMYDQALWLNIVGKKWFRKITCVILCRNLRDTTFTSYDMEQIRGKDLQEMKSLGLV